MGRHSFLVCCVDSDQVMVCKYCLFYLLTIVFTYWNEQFFLQFNRILLKTN